MASVVAAAKADISNSTAYQKKLMDLVGEREPLAVLRETPEVIAGMLRGVSSATLRRRPFAERWTWTPLEVVGHLCDGEIVYGWRIRMVLSEDRPRITPMDQDKWVAAQRYNERERDELIETFRNLRASIVRLWECVKPGDFKRVGLHDERGEEALGTMLKMHAGHDLSHIEQLKKYLGALS